MSAPDFWDLADEIKVEHDDLLDQFEAHPGGETILRNMVEGVFPLGLEDAIATHPTYTTEREVIISLIAALTIAVEKGIAR